MASITTSLRDYNTHVAKKSTPSFVLFREQCIYQWPELVLPSTGHRRGQPVVTAVLWYRGPKWQQDSLCRCGRNKLILGHLKYWQQKCIFFSCCSLHSRKLTRQCWRLRSRRLLTLQCPRPPTDCISAPTHQQNFVPKVILKCGLVGGGPQTATQFIDDGLTMSPESSEFWMQGLMAQAAAACT